MARRARTQQQTETLVRSSRVVGSRLDLDRALEDIGAVVLELL